MREAQRTHLATIAGMQEQMKQLAAHVETLKPQ